MSKQAHVPSLLNLFRQFGYDGVTLAKISQATGLGKASLYHHFPGGKDEMVETVLITLEAGLENILAETLHGDGDVVTRLQKMSDRIRAVYEDGQKPCLLASLLLGSAKAVFHERLQRLLDSWITAIADVLIEAGLEPTLARQRGEDAVIAIQGALIVAQGMGNPLPFQRVMQELPHKLCQPSAC